MRFCLLVLPFLLLTGCVETVTQDVYKPVTKTGLPEGMESPGTSPRPNFGPTDSSGDASAKFVRLAGGEDLGARPRWEYRVISFPGDTAARKPDDTDEIEERLNRLGDQGWELVNLRSDTYFLKRTAAGF